MQADHVLRDTDSVLSPGLLFYLDRIEHNLRTAIRIAGGPQRLRPHVKTHKTPQIARMMLQAGITRHKAATIAEAEMLAAVEAPDVLVAYPMVGPNVARLVKLAEQYPGTQFSCLVDDPEPARILGAAASKRGRSIDVYLDLDVGMHRTGIDPDERSVRLFLELADLPGLRPVGLSAYDGHNLSPDADEQRAMAQAFMTRVVQVREAIARAGVPVPRVVVGGTPQFPVHAMSNLPGLELSPGTFILQDASYGAAHFPDLADFQPAALVLTRVISRPTAGRLTFDLGHKAVAADPGPVERRLRLLDLPEATPVMQSEEHLMVQTPRAGQFRPGDVAYALPGHVCPTVALHDFAYVVREGAVVDQWQITARRRVLGI